MKNHDMLIVQTLVKPPQKVKESKMMTFESSREKTREQVKKENPLHVIRRVNGGWLVFESVQEYRTWKNQR